MKCQTVFEAYGVRVRIEADDPELFSSAEETSRKALVDRIRILDTSEAEHAFGFTLDEDGTFFLFQNGEMVSFDDSRTRFFKFFNAVLRIVVAEHAPDKVFIHAGVVARDGKAIVIPANSFAGKTTLVAELVKNGAEYYSDEYAVIDAAGLVHPFPRDLSVRDSSFLETDVSVEALGGRIGVTPVPIRAVLLTEYGENAQWDPKRLTTGQGIIEMIPHTIARNSNTEFSLKVLNTAVRDAIILKGLRGDARDFATKFLFFFDNFTNLTKIN